MDCENIKVNKDKCNCSYPGCSRKGNCCDCLHYHLSRRELPGCVFPDDVEKSWDRSFEKFIEVYG
ncbi:MAG: cytosolic protein [Candidatus Latescibacteria bacterium]|nr:cytosolic protein [bacterium]MBD3423636.1 cytosolic protein [Candidatus Latescibacterota bacterium]